MAYTLGRLKTFTLAGVLHYLSLKLRRRSIGLRGHCLQCGYCCRSICLADNQGWLRTEKNFLKIIVQFPEYERFEITGEDSAGNLLFSCTWCGIDGKCRDYDQRLDICKKYPEKSLVFAGGELPAKCGYYFVEHPDFKKLLRREMRRTR